MAAKTTIKYMPTRTFRGVRKSRGKARASAALVYIPKKIDSVVLGSVLQFSWEIKTKKNKQICQIKPIKNTDRD